MKSYSALQNGSDIRGTASDMLGRAVDLDAQAAWDLSLAFGKWLAAKCGRPAFELSVAVGRDSRLSGPELQNTVGDALFSLGIKVLDCGLASTPAMFMSCVFPECSADGAVMITASHLPADRNGFKYFTKTGGLDRPDIAEIVRLAEEQETPLRDDISDFESFGLMELYCAHLRKVIADGLGADESEKPLAGMNIAVDAGGGAGGFYVSGVLELLGADCSGSIYLEPDGLFTGHVPNPESPQAMEAVCAAAKAAGADLGLIFDTDVDRAAAVGSNGKPIARNAAIALAAAIVADSHPGCTVVTDSVTSGHLREFLEDKLGLRQLRYQRGYRNVINKALALGWEGVDAQLAIETSGHAALRENYFLDDGAYLAAKIAVKAAQMKRLGKGVEDCIAELKEPAEAAEYRIPVKAEDFQSYADGVLSAVTAAVEAGELPGMKLELPNYEGVRVSADPEHGNGWFLIRKSLHEPLMPVNVESDSEGGAEMIKDALYGLLASFKGLELS